MPLCCAVQPWDGCRGWQSGRGGVLVGEDLFLTLLWVVVYLHISLLPDDRLSINVAQQLLAFVNHFAYQGAAHLKCEGDGGGGWR